MRRLLWLALWMATGRAQSSPDATELLERAKAFGQNTKSWRAEVIQTMQVSLQGRILKSEMHTRIAAQPTLKMSRIKSGGDRTMMVCDGNHFFYSGDGLGYFKYAANQQCDLPLIAFYDSALMRLPERDSSLVSLLVIGEDHVRLTDGDRRCVVVRAVSKEDSQRIVRNMCIDPSRPLMLRDVMETEDDAKKITTSTTTTFVSFENDPSFTPDTFRFSVPPGAVEARPPM